MSIKVQITQPSSVNLNVATGQNSITVGSDGDNHNDLKGIQGGIVGQRYHLSQNEVSLIHQNDADIDTVSGLLTDDLTAATGELNNRLTIAESDIITVSGLLSNDPLTDIVFQTGDQTITGIKTFTDNLIVDADIYSNTNKKVIATDSAPLNSDLLVYDDDIDEWVSSPVLFSDGSDPYSPYSIATQQKLMKGGYKFRQMIMVNSQFSGGNPNTVADGYNVLGMKAQIGGVANQTASCYTFDNIRTHGDVSASTMPMIQDLDLYFHGCGLRFTADGNWKARVNVGVGDPTRIPQFNNFYPETPARWGVEFDYVPADTYFRCRLFFVDQNEIENYSTYKYLPMYSASQAGGWAGYVYSMRFKQTVISSNSLYLEFFMNEATSNVGGSALPDVPIVALNINGIPIPRRYSGRYVNFEVVSDPFNDPTNIVSLQTASMFCQYR